MLPYVVPVLSFLAVIAFAGFLWRAIGSRADARRADLQDRLARGDRRRAVTRQVERDPVARALGPFGRAVADLLAAAGSDLTVGPFLVLTGSLGVVGVVAVGEGPWPAAVLLAAVLAGLPTAWMVRRASRRSAQLSRQLPDALDLITRALRSGHAFSDALRQTASEIAHPLRDELLPIAEEHALGLELRECLEELIARNPRNQEFRLLSSAVMLHRQTGSNLIEILDQLAETVRDRVVFEQRVKALTAEVRTSAAILAGLPFLAAMALTLTAPRYLAPLGWPGMGRTMLLSGGLWMLVGLAMMRRVARVGGA